MNKELHMYMSMCFKENIKIYPIIYNRSSFKIEINYDGRIKTGKEVYSTTEQKKMQKRIIELYYEIGDKIQSRK